MRQYQRSASQCAGMGLLEWGGWIAQKS